MRLVPLNMFKPSSVTDRSRVVRLLWILLVFMLHIWLDAYVMSPYEFVIGVSGQVWYLIVSIPDLCLLFFCKYVLCFNVTLFDTALRPG